MTKLSTEQFLYLLYAYSYCLQQKTVIKSAVKKALSTKEQKSADSIYDALLKQSLIESPSRGRLSVTSKGISTLVDNVVNIDFQFSNKNSQHRMLNTLMQCWKLAASNNKLTTSVRLDFDTFLEKFKTIYFEERKRQELSGVVVIRKEEIRKQLMTSNQISEEEFNEYFNKLKSTGKIFVAAGKDDELVNWVE